MATGGFVVAAAPFVPLEEETPGAGMVVGADAAVACAAACDSLLLVADGDAVDDADGGTDSVSIGNVCWGSAACMIFLLLT